MNSLVKSAGIGTDEEVGTVDIYFNGGNRQPGCERQVMETILSDGILDGLPYFALIADKLSLIKFAFN